MNLYLDTSALVKIFAEEPGREDVIRAVASADVSSVSTLAYVEARAALARRWREGSLSASDYRRSVRDMDREWPQFLRLEVAESIIMAAADLVEPHQLRAADAIHLASALSITERFREVVFVCWDHRLNAAARKAGLTTLIQ